MSEQTLPPLRDLQPPRRLKGFRVAPPGSPMPAHAESPVFPLEAADLWRAWMDVAARQPRTTLGMKDERTFSSLHVQRSSLFHFPDLVRAEVVPLGDGRSSLVLDSRARFGGWDFGVNRRRVTHWLRDLQRRAAEEQRASDQSPGLAPPAA